MPLGIYRRVALPFVALAAGVIGVVLLVLFSRATVTIFSARKDLAADFTVTVARDPGQGEVRGNVFDATDTVSQAFPATSVAEVDAHAEGKVRITSTLFRSQTLIASTRLLTSDGKLYRIKKTVIVPANGSVEAAAFADVPGAAGETADATFTIPGLNPDTAAHFTVTTTSPFTGGSKTVRAVTQSDFDSAVAVLKDKLARDITKRLEAKAGGFSGTFVTIDVPKKSTDVAVGSSADKFEVSVTVHVVLVAYDAAALMREVEGRLESQVPEGWHATIIGTPARIVEKTDATVGRANIRVTVKAVVSLKAGNPALQPEKLVGVTAESARSYLQSIDGVSSASIRLKPFWAGRMPAAADHITVEIR